jgi:hypothetical protein
MGFSTMSGPLRTGTVRNTTGTTADTMDNTGVVVLIQAKAITYADTGATVAVLPAGAQIINFVVDTTTQFNAATTLSLGDGTTANKYLDAAVITGGASGSRITQAVIDAKFIEGFLTNIGSSNVKIVATLGGTATAGAATITVVYAQKASDGSEVPASS